MTDSVVTVQKYIPQQYLEVLGKNLPAIMNAVNGIYGNTEELIQACIDQLFLSTASGRFLVQNGEQRGFAMPDNSGLDIRAYRVLVPLMVADPKQVRITMNEVIKAFYGTDRTRPSVDSSVFGPYSLLDGDDLIVETESGTIRITIVEGQVSDLTVVSAPEIAAVINSVQSEILAAVVEDRQTGKSFVRLSSTTAAPLAFIRIAGGSLQNVLKFPVFIETLNTTGTIWNLTKTSEYTDELKFTWNGAGTNPNVFLAKKDDIITIRALVDGVKDFSVLNGSYAAVDVGYDYFIIRNDRFDHTTATLTQPNDNNIVFTSSQKLLLFDKDEFAMSSETEKEAITVTIPAIPPLTRRFLAGSAHLQGSVSDVLDFTRNSIKIELAVGSDKPVGENWFILSGKRMRYNGRRKYYKTVTVDTDLSTPTYNVDTADDDSSVLPYVVPVPIGTDSIWGEIDSDLYDIGFSLRHGIRRSWGFTLSGATGAGNIAAGDINKEHVANAIPNEDSAQVRLKDSSGFPLSFEGFGWGPADVERVAIPRNDGADFKLVFASEAARIASGLEDGMSFRIDPGSGTDVVFFIADALKHRKLATTTVDGANVYFSAGLGVGSEGSVITGITGKRSGYFGGTISYFVDKTSAHNIDYVLEDLKASMIGHTPSSNPDYVGSFIYDPTSEETSVTVSNLVVKMTENILRGENKQALLVDSVSVDGEDLPQMGLLVIDYGFDNFEGPIQFNAVIENPSTSQILIDPSYKFKYSHSEGAQVQVIHKVTAYTPTRDGDDYPVYLTGAVQARKTLFELLDLLVATGIFVEEDLIIPELRYQDTAISPYE